MGSHWGLPTGEATPPRIAPEGPSHPGFSQLPTCPRSSGIASSLPRPGPSGRDPARAVSPHVPGDGPPPPRAPRPPYFRGPAGGAGAPACGDASARPGPGPRPPLLARGAPLLLAKPGLGPAVATGAASGARSGGEGGGEGHRVGPGRGGVGLGLGRARDAARVTPRRRAQRRPRCAHGSRVHGWRHGYGAGAGPARRGAAAGGSGVADSAGALGDPDAG